MAHCDSCSVPCDPKHKGVVAWTVCASDSFAIPCECPYRPRIDYPIIAIKWTEEVGA